MPLDRTLLDLDRAPTLAELKAFFRKHDWSAAKLSEPEGRSTDKSVGMKKVKEVMDAAFEKSAREKGLSVPSRYYENRRRFRSAEGNLFNNQGNPLLELRDNTEDLVSDAVYEIAENQEEVLEGILSQFDFNDPDLERKADAFLHTAVGTMLDVMGYETMAKLIGANTNFEDFNPNIPLNFRAMDHETKWYHLDTKHPTLPDPDLEELYHDQNPGTEEKAVANVMVEEYWKKIDKTERTIIKMTMAGYTQTEIASEIGMANNSGVSKRLDKIRREFPEKSGIPID